MQRLAEEILARHAGGDHDKASHFLTMVIQVAYEILGHRSMTLPEEAAWVLSTMLGNGGNLTTTG